MAVDVSSSIEYERVETDDTGDCEGGSSKQEKDTIASGDDYDYDNSDDEVKKEDELVVDEKSTLMELFFYMMGQALPICISLLLYSLNNFILMYFAGNLQDDSFVKVSDENEGEKVSNGTIIFAGISLANMYANVTGFAFLCGMSSAVETVASQQNGAKRYKDVGITLLRCIFVLGVLTVPIVLAWIFVKEIFQVFDVAEEVCEVMKCYLRVRAWSLPAEVLSLSYSKYLTAMGVMKPEMYISFLNNISLASMAFFFTSQDKGMGAGVEGLAWAYVLMIYLGVVAIVLISYRLKEVERTLPRTLCIVDILDIRELKEFIALGVPGCAMICSEWWAFEILTLFASRLGAAAVSAQGILLQLAGFAFMLPLGFAFTSSSMVGNALGAKRKRLAVSLSKISLGIIFLLEICLISPVVLWCGQAFIMVFTEDDAVIRMAGKAVHLLAFLILSDGMQGVSGGIMRGAGKQFVGALTNIFSYYCIGLPAAWFLCFHAQLGVSGLLLGISAGAAIQSTILVGLILCCSTWIFAQNQDGTDTSTVDANHIKDTEMAQLLDRNDDNSV